ncbi:MAG: ATP synthase F0 subunit B [Myxococcota bacterium]
MNKKALGLLGFLAAALPAVDALAAGGGGGAHGGGHAPHVEFWKWSMEAPPIGWMVFDFAVFMFLLVRYAGKPLSNYLVQRHTGVKKAMEEAAAAKAEAERKAREYEDRIKKLDAEVAAIKEDFVRNGQLVRERLVENGKVSADRLLKDAQLTISAEEKRALESLKSEAARLALEMAEKMVRERLAAPDHKRMTDDFIRELRS